MDFAISNNFCLLHSFGVWLPRNIVAVAIGNNNTKVTAIAAVKLMCNIIKFICIPRVPNILFNFCILCRTRVTPYTDIIGFILKGAPPCQNNFVKPVVNNCLT